VAAGESLARHSLVSAAGEEGQGSLLLQYTACGLRPALALVVKVLRRPKCRTKRRCRALRRPRPRNR
jgi:hypothetical protein